METWGKVKKEALKKARSKAKEINVVGRYYQLQWETDVIIMYVINGLF